MRHLQMTDNCGIEDDRVLGVGDVWELIRPGEQDRTLSVRGMVETLCE